MLSSTTVTETSSFAPLIEEPLELVAAITQDALSVTLSAPAIIMASAGLIAAIHLLPPVVVAGILAFLPVVLFIHNDFQNYLKLGPGGTPSTFRGYLKINWLKVWSLRDPLKPLPVDAGIQPARGILNKEPLPYRSGPRPTVVGIAPQRQTNQFGSRECYLALRRILIKQSEEHPKLFGIGTSCFEKHGLGLFSRSPFNQTCKGEIVHVHNSDHSMHLNLHPEDAKEVLEKGWGERHPLTSQGWYKMSYVPKHFTMVYAPRNRDELRTICRIIEAAGYWVMAEDIPLPEDEKESSTTQ